MDSVKNFGKTLSTTDYTYAWVHIFFWVSELFISFAFFSVKQSIDMYNMEFYFIGRIVGELQPASMLLVGYITDSFVGKYIMFHVTSGFTVVGSVVLLIAYSVQEFSSTLGFCLIVFVVIGKGWHPLRYAIVYSQLTPPLNKIRRFVVIHVAAHALGEALVYLLDMIKLSRKARLLWLLSQLIATTVAFYVTVVILYKYRYLRLYYKENATEKALVSIHRAVREKTGVKEEAQRKIPEDELKYAMGLLFVLLVIGLCTIIYFDSCIVKFYLGEYRNYVPSSDVPREIPMAFLFYLGGVLLILTIEFIVIPICAHYKVYVSYITMITMAFIMATAALLTLGILSVKMGFAAPFPPPFEGDAHLTVFNCLPVMTELEWPDGRIVSIPAFFYHRILNIPVKGGLEMELRDIGVFNTAFALYELANLTIHANRENIIVVKNNGATQVNISSTMIHTRQITSKGQVRILDCLENCCHGQILFELHGRPYLTYDLKENYMSEKMEMSRGLYQVFYSPNKHQKVHLGEVNIIKTSKLVLMIHSLKNPGVKSIHFISMEFNQYSYYFPLIIFRTMIHVLLDPYLKLLIILKTDSTIYTVMFGILLSVEYMVEIASVLVYPTFSSYYLFYVTVIVFTGLFFFLFLLMVIKMNRYVSSGMPLTFRPDRNIQKPVASVKEKKKPRMSGSSGYSKDSEALSTLCGLPVQVTNSSDAAPCTVSGITYLHSQQITREDPCDFCLCLDGEVFCWWQQQCLNTTQQQLPATSQDNSTTSASDSEEWVEESGHNTTETPAPQESMCRVMGVEYKIGEVLPRETGTCLQCQCSPGARVTCSPKDCTSPDQFHALEQQSLDMFDVDVF